MRRDRSITVAADPARVLTFDVVVHEQKGESRHSVTISADDAARYSGSGLDPALCVEAAMTFLLDREPKESILGAFDISVIRRYFPEFDETFPVYLARLARGQGVGD
jgi:hypothetical protein